MARITHGMIWYSLGLLIIGFVVGYMLPDGRASFVSYHLGGLGAVSLLACVSAMIARNKGFNYWHVWLVTVLLSVVLGLIAAYLLPTKDGGAGPAACGGSVSLGVGLILIGVWSFIGGRRGGSERPIREE